MKFSIAVLAAVVSTAAAQDFSPIVAAGDYGTLLQLVTDAGLVPTLAANVPVTVFGPTDAVFAAADLTGVDVSATLLNHVVVDANVTSSMVVAAGCVEAVAAGGLQLGISYNASSGAASVNGVPIVEFDIAGDYGVLHGIDGILSPDSYVPCSTTTPPMLPDDSFVNKVAAEGNYTTLIDALMNTEGALSSLAFFAPVTVFGPDDAAFAAVADTVQGLDEAELLGVLAGHVLPEKITADDIKAAGCKEYKDVMGATDLKVEYHEDHDHDHDHDHDDDRRKLAGHNKAMVMVNGIEVILADVDGSDGIFHGINGVILPGSFTPCPAPDEPMEPSASPMGDGMDDSSSTFSAIVAMAATAAAAFAF